MRKIPLVVPALVLTAAMGAVAPLGAAGPFQYHSITPCRLADTRRPVDVSGGPALLNNGVRQFPVQGLCGVPDGARAVTINVTAVGPTGPGFLTLYPAGITTPLVSSLNFVAFEPAIGNGGIVPLADQALEPNDLAVYAAVLGGPGTVHMVLDVTGYFQ